MERQSFIFYKSFYDSIKLLPKKLRLELYEAIIEYAIYEKNSKELSQIATSYFILIKPILEKNSAKYKNALKGGAARKRSKAKSYSVENEEYKSGSEEIKESGCTPNSEHKSSNPNVKQTQSKRKPKVKQTQPKLNPYNIYIEDDVDVEEDVDVDLKKKRDEGEREEEDEVLRNSHTHKTEFFSLKSCYDILLSDESWSNLICINYKLSPPEFKESLTHFFKDLELRGEISKDPKDARKHFASWLKININKNLKRGKGYEKRGEVSDCEIFNAVNRAFARREL